MDLHGPWVGPTSVAAVAVVVAGSRLVHKVEAKHDREGHELWGSPGLCYEELAADGPFHRSLVFLK